MGKLSAAITHEAGEEVRGSCPPGPTGLATSGPRGGPRTFFTPVRGLRAPLLAPIEAAIHRGLKQFMPPKACGELLIAAFFSGPLSSALHGPARLIIILVDDVEVAA